MDMLIVADEIPALGRFVLQLCDLHVALVQDLWAALDVCGAHEIEYLAAVRSQQACFQTITQIDACIVLRA